MKIVFFGTPDFAVESLSKLNEKHEIVMVVTKPDAKKSRGHKLSPSAVKRFALLEGLSVITPEVLDTTFVNILKELKPDVFVVVAYGKILKESIINIPRYGSINIHASLLPKYRGASPLQSALLHGDKVSGVTIMTIDKQLDSGDILLKKEIDITQHNLSSLHDALASLGSEAILEVLDNITYYIDNREKQDDSKASYCKKINKADGQINWDDSAESIYNKIRAFTPIISVYTFLNNERFIITDSSYNNDSTSFKPGTIIDVDDSGIKVACGRGTLIIHRLKVPGKREMLVNDYLKGNILKKDMILGG